MGFLDFVKKIGNGLKKGVETIGGGIKKAAVSIHHSILKPIYKSVIKPVYEKAVKPVGKRVVNFVSHGIDRIERLSDAGVKGVEGIGAGISNLGNSPMMLFGLLALGGIVALKR